MKKIKILLTYDYELPLGAASDYQQALFLPSQKLLSLANEVGVPLVLFADICSAIRFKEWDFTSYYLPFKDQLQGAISKGHDVQLHIHPHWMNSTFSKNTFNPSKNFSLSSFKDETGDCSIEHIIEEAFAELRGMLHEIDEGYECIAFRAGGYDVEPESKRILNKLYELGIRIESSVIRDFYLDYNFSHIDYSNVPDLPHWFVSKDGPLSKVSASGLLELPISSRPLRMSDIVKRRLNKTLHSELYKSRRYQNSGKGFLAVSGKQNLKSKYRKMINPVVLTFDREYQDVNDLESVVYYNVKKYTGDEDLYITLIAHPKSMGDYHCNLMRRFIERMRVFYGNQVEFITYRQVKTDFKL